MTDDCDKCEGWKPKLRKGTRCESCEEKFTAYKEGGWGLNELSRERLINQELGLCFMCGGGLENPQSQMCNDCDYDYHNRNWHSQQLRKGTASDGNPYNSVWDAFEDNTTYLVPSYGVLANRMRDKARYYGRLAERGGPRGREAASDAAIYNRIAEGLDIKETESRRLR